MHQLSRPGWSSKSYRKEVFQYQRLTRPCRQNCGWLFEDTERTSPKRVCLCAAAHSIIDTSGLELGNAAKGVLDQRPFSGFGPSGLSLCQDANERRGHHVAATWLWEETGRRGLTLGSSAREAVARQRSCLGVASRPAIGFSFHFVSACFVSIRFHPAQFVSLHVIETWPQMSEALWPRCTSVLSGRDTPVKSTAATRRAGVRSMPKAVSW